MMDYRMTAQMFKALCDENRLRIIHSLQSGEKCACTLLAELPIAQSTLSHHMKILVGCRLVRSRKEGKWTYYQLADDGCHKLQRQLADILEKSQDYQQHVTCHECWD